MQQRVYGSIGAGVGDAVQTQMRHVQVSEECLSGFAYSLLCVKSEDCLSWRLKDGYIFKEKQKS